jgi:hypothetical protein
MTVSKWPEELQTRTAAEWRAIGAQWEVADNRKIVVDTLTALKIPAMQYARAKGPERVEIVIKAQEELVPGSTAEKKAAAPAAAAPKAAAPKAAAPKAAAPVATGGGTVDLGPILARLEAQDAAIATLQASATEISTILKLLLLNPSNADSLTLAASAEVVEEIGSKSITELAGNA